MTHSFPTRRSSDLLMGEAQGIDFRVDQLDDRFAKLFPQDFSAALRTDQRVLNARTRLDMSMDAFRSEEHTSELQSLMRTSYAVFCLKKQHRIPRIQHTTHKSNTNTPTIHYQ